MSAPSLAVISDAMNPGATALTYKSEPRLNLKLPRDIVSCD